MATAKIEHLNITVLDPQRSADLLCEIFGWVVRWKGPSMLGGETIHVGEPHNGQTYLALYNYDSKSVSVLNHVGVMVDDLDAVEQRVLAAGLTPTNHGDYEPGRRFYFDDHDGIEFEVVSYR
jgi:catechol 2,3-dioxygenase-like lactoylglutathione lyase family enzyme